MTHEGMDAVLGGSIPATGVYWGPLCMKLLRVCSPLQTSLLQGRGMCRGLLGVLRNFGAKFGA
jgi:hypothetical protein